MKSLLLLFSFSAAALPPDIPPDAGFGIYQKLERQLRSQDPTRFGPLDTIPKELPLETIERAITLGARASAWVEALNKRRPDDRKLYPGKAAKRGGIPIESPIKYSPSLIATELALWESEAPAEFRDVLITATKNYDTQFVVSEEEFLKFQRKIQVVYAHAVRWKAMQPYMDYMRNAKVRDLRGLVFLSREQNLEERLRNFAGLDEGTRNLWREYLYQMCLNNEREFTTCNEDVTNALTNGQAFESYQRWLPESQAMYNAMFKAQWLGTDISWTDPARSTLKAGVKSTGDNNIEASFSEALSRLWQIGAYSLTTDFKPNYILEISFVTGALAHYQPGKIVMDQRADMRDEQNQIILAHEFGHALGLPDCYVEFYDAREAAMLSYQLDVENLMCSLNGKVNEQHYEALREAYP